MFLVSFQLTTKGWKCISADASDVSSLSTAQVDTPESFLRAVESIGRNLLYFTQSYVYCLQIADQFKWLKNTALLVCWPINWIEILSRLKFTPRSLETRVDRYKSGQIFLQPEESRRRNTCQTNWVQQFDGIESRSLKYAVL